MAVLQFKRGSSSSWVSLNPVLAAGEPGFETDTNKLKVGNGSLSWNSLPYLVSGALRFRGTLGTGGTVTVLPSIYDAGWTYKVITAGTYAGNICEVGDLIISTNDRPTGGGNNSDWTAVQDNIEGTFYAASQWSADVEYLAGDLVFNNGSLYSAKINNNNQLVTNTTYWENVGEGYRLNIDGNSISNIPFPVTDLIAGANITITNNDGQFTISTNNNDIKINNPSNNSVFTSNGTTSSINAEPNFIYNDVTGVTTLRGEDVNLSLRLINSSNTATRCPRIELRRNRNSLANPQSLDANDSIGTINFTTLAKNGADSFGGQILAYTQDGLSTYDYVPTVLKISNRMTNGSMNDIYVHDDGTFNPRNGMIVNDDQGAKYWSDQRSETVQIFASSANSPLEDKTATGSLLSWSFANISQNNTSNSCVASSSRAHMSIPTGTKLESNSILVGQDIGAFRNALVGYTDNGTLQSIVGCRINYGHLPRVPDVEPQTSLAAGIWIYPWAGEGNITAAYDIILGNEQQTQVLDEAGTSITGDGTISTRYGIVQLNNNPNILAGSLQVDNGLSAPKPIHSLGSVSGNVSISYGVDKQIQTLLLNGTATNFIIGSGWPGALYSAEILLEISVSSTTTVTWDIVDDWYNPVPSFTIGKYLVLLRSMGSTMQGHFIGAKTN